MDFDYFYKREAERFPYLAFFYLGNIFSNHVRSYVGGDVIDKIFQGILELNTMSFFPSIHLMDMTLIWTMTPLICCMRNLTI